MVRSCDAKCDAISSDRGDLLARAVVLVAGMAIPEAVREAVLARVVTDLTTDGDRLRGEGRASRHAAAGHTGPKRFRAAAGPDDDGHRWWAQSPEPCHNAPHVAPAAPTRRPTEADLENAAEVIHQVARMKQELATAMIFSLATRTPWPNCSARLRGGMFRLRVP